MKPYLQHGLITLYNGDCRDVLRALPAGSVNTCVTSPPYWGLRDYGHDGQIGLEQTPAAYVAEMVDVFREVRRVLRDDGTLWLNLGDSYAGSWGAQSRGDFTPGTLEGASSREHCLSARQIKAHPKGTHTGSLKNTPGLKAKDLVGIPWRVAFALQEDGWYLRSDIIWAKTACMPESITDRPTKSHEYLFLLAKSERYYYDHEAVKEPVAESTVARINQDLDNQIGSFRAHAGERGERTMKCVGDGEKRNRRSVWNIAPASYSGAHFATFPPKLIEPCILAGCPAGGTVLDPFFGAGTTGLVCQQQGVNCVGVELNPEYCAIASRRLAQGVLFGGAA